MCISVWVLLTLITLLACLEEIPNKQIDRIAFDSQRVHYLLGDIVKVHHQNPLSIRHCYYRLVLSDSKAHALFIEYSSADVCKKLLTIWKTFALWSIYLGY